MQKGRKSGAGAAELVFADGNCSQPMVFKDVLNIFQAYAEHNVGKGRTGRKTEGQTLHLRHSREWQKYKGGYS